MAKEKLKVGATGDDSEGGITSSYKSDDGVKLKVAYSFFGSIYDDDEKEAVLAAMKQDSLTMGPQVKFFPSLCTRNSKKTRWTMSAPRLRSSSKSKRG